MDSKHVTGIHVKFVNKNHNMNGNHRYNIYVTGIHAFKSQQARKTCNKNTCECEQESRCEHELQMTCEQVYMNVKDNKKGKHVT